MRLAAAMCLVAAPALAEPDWPASAGELQMLDILGGQGCVLSDETSQVLEANGFAFDNVQLMAVQAQAGGQAHKQGAYIVFDADICTIRLPDITSRWSVKDPSVRAMAPFIRDEYEIAGEVLVDEGCFAQDAMAQFTALNGGDAEAGYQDYISTMAVGIIEGDIRFYSDDPLRTPRAFQIMTGECSNVANADDIERSHPAIGDSFDAWLRAAMAYNSCDARFGWPPGIDARLQGADVSVDVEDQPSVNAFMGLEWTLITLAAGWHEGFSATERGVPRPPLCHYSKP